MKGNRFMKKKRLTKVKLTKTKKLTINFGDLEKAEKLNLDYHIKNGRIIWKKTNVIIARALAVVYLLSDGKKLTTVKIGTVKEICDYYDSLNDPSAFNLLLDVGHSAIVGQAPQDAIRILGKDRLFGLHIQDNDGVRDLHNIPFDVNGSIDWEAVAKALGEIGYQGDFTYEANSFLKRHTEETIPLALQYMERLGRYLMGRIAAHQ